jgi:curli production assembly/transport component CsgF
MSIARSSVFAVMVLVCCGTTPVEAQQLRYAPTNPHFGGSPFNGAELLSSAAAQRVKRPTSRPLGATSDARSPLRDFANNLEARISSRLSQYVSDQIFSQAAGASASGTFTLSGLSVSYQRLGSTEVRRVLRDLATGETSTVTYPLKLFVP